MATFQRGPTGGSFGGGGWGLSGPIPRDVGWLLGVLFATFSLQYFDLGRPLVALLRLTAQTWQSGHLWRPLTYVFAGVGVAGFWIIVELLVLFLFARTVFYQLGRKRFWELLLLVAGVAAVVALGVDAVPGVDAQAFVLMQGQRMVLAVVIAAFATMNRDATVLLFFVLPVKASWFLGLELLFAFMGYLSTGDLAGFLGITVAIGLTFWLLARGWTLRRLWLTAQEKWIRRKLDKRRSRFDVVQGGGKGGSDDDSLIN